MTRDQQTTDALDALDEQVSRSLEIAARPLPSGQPVEMPPIVAEFLGPNLKKFFGSKTNAV
jgi:hypothetical protein